MKDTMHATSFCFSSIEHLLSAYYVPDIALNAMRFKDKKDTAPSSSQPGGGSKSRVQINNTRLHM